MIKKNSNTPKSKFGSKRETKEKKNNSNLYKILLLKCMDF